MFQSSTRNRDIGTMLIQWVILVTLMKNGASIHIISKTQDSRIKESSSTQLTCATDQAWFLCVWTSPLDNKLCAIQETQVSSVCAGDPRIFISGTERSCSISISNISTKDWGDWRCLVQDGLDFNKEQKYINIEVATAAKTTLNRPHDIQEDESEFDDKILNVMEDSVTEISCIAKRAFPRPYITWTGDEMEFIVINEVANYNNVTHEFTVESHLKYVAKLNDTNSTLTCIVKQEDFFSNLETMTINVNPKPLPLIKTNDAETAGIIAGVILGIIFLLLILVLALMLVSRRKRRQRESPESTMSSDSSPNQWSTLRRRVWGNFGDNMKQRVWSTPSSGQFVNSGRYHGDWSKVLHDNRHKMTQEPNSGATSGSQQSIDTVATGVGINDNTKTTSSISELTSGSINDSYQTDKDNENMSVSLCPGPSLPETHFSELVPNTVYHHSAPYLETGYYYNRKPSSVRSADIWGNNGRDSGVSFLSSRPVSALDVYSPSINVPMRVSTPTCAGSKSSVSMFQCPHDCFLEKDTIEEIDEGSGDTIEEMDEDEDIESIKKLVNRGLDIGTDSFTDSSEDKSYGVRRKPTAVTPL